MSVNISKNERYIIYDGILTQYVINKIGDVFRIKKSHRYLLKSRLDKDGYMTVILHINGKPHFCRICRLVGLTFIDVPDELQSYDIKDLQINHKNGIHDDDYVGNLEWVTPKGNIHHAWNTGLSKAKYCEDHPNSVYNNEEIIRVCELISSAKFSYKEISDFTGVSYTVVKQIKNRVIWNEISKNYDFPDKLPRSKPKRLSEESVKNIIYDIKKSGETLEEISKKYNVTSAAISRIKHDYIN